jgi:hypothetical protein
MKKTTAILAGTALLLGGAYLAARPSRAAAATVAAPQRDRQPQMRTLSGTVSDGSGAALGGAVVYLKNTRTLAVKTYIAQDDGKYQFNSLAPNADYEVYAEHGGKRSGTKRLSSFDSRGQVIINLTVEK